MRFVTAALVVMLGSLACEAETPFHAIDLRSSVTMGFRDEIAEDQTGGWTDQGPANDMAVLKRGTLEYQGIPFEIIDSDQNEGKSCIVLRGKYRPWFQLESTIIPVESQGDIIYFLGTCAWGASIGEDVLRMIVEYDERSAYCDTDFCFGKHMGSWWSPLSLPLADVAWEGSNGSAEVGLYCFAWENPYPEETIRSIKFISSDSDAVPIIVAATLVKKSEASERLLADLSMRKEKSLGGSEGVSCVEVSLDLSSPIRSIPGFVASASNGKTVNPIYIPQGKNLAKAGSEKPFYRIQTHSTEPSVSLGVYDFSQLDEVLDYIDELGFEPMLSISKGPHWIRKVASDGTPLKRWIPNNVEVYSQYCQEIVRHCSARQNPVLWYEIGNEPDLKGWSYKLYIQLFQTVAGPLREIDSRIKLGGPVTCGPNIGWAKLLIENAGEDVDFVSYHQYGYSEDFSSPDKHIMSRLSLYETSARKYKEMLREHNSDCLVFVTEANTSWRFPKTDPRIRNQFGAAWTASAVGKFLVGGGDVFHFFTYNGGFGMTWVQRGENRLFPVYHSYWMLRTFLTGQLIPAETSQDVVNAFGYINSSEAGAFIINSTDRPMDVTLQFENNPVDAQEILFHVLNEQTWQDVRTVSEEGIVPELRTFRGELSQDGVFTIKLAPYEVRLVRLVNEAVNTDGLELWVEEPVTEYAGALSMAPQKPRPVAEELTDSAVPENNLLPNSSVERGSEIIKGMPADWSLYPADATGTWDRDVFRSGGKSLRIDSSGTRGTFWFSDLAVDVSPGETLELRGYVKTQAGWGNNTIKLIWYDASGKWIASSYSTPVDGTKEWVELTVVETAPERAATAKVFVGRRYATEKGLSWFDDVTLTRVPVK